MEVIKIGGSLLNDVHDIEKLACSICDIYIKSKKLPVIVISAFKDHTDELIKMSSNFAATPSSVILTAGEQITAGLLEMALQKKSIKAQALMGWQVPIKVESIISAEKTVILNLISKGIIPIIAGFQGVDENNEIKDLGRGGSDLTAVCVAKALDAKCILLKKHGGICSADPELISNCFVWDNLGYDNLLHLAQAGSPVIQKEALIYAKENNVSICVSSLSSQKKTNITDFNEGFWNLFLYNKKLRLVSSKKNDSLKGFGFNFKNEYYECENFDSLHTSKVYEACREFYR